jgi:hypothetical protein
MDPIKFPVAKQDDLCSRGYQVVELLDQRNMHVLGKVPLFAPAYLPYQRQGTPLVDDVHHQRYTPAPYNAAIHDHHQRLQGEMPQQDFDIRNKIDPFGDGVVVYPPGKALYAALRLGAIGHLRGNFG